MDTRTPDQRRKIMQAVRSRNTGPELAVRRILHRMGYRFRLHRADLPGRPDIVLPARRTAIFVHGCFWHGHGCAKGRLPKSRPDYWQPKIATNAQRDRDKAESLQAADWRVVTLWQCELKDPDALADRLRGILGPPKNPIDTADQAR